MQVSMPKTSSIRAAVSIEHRLVTDRHRAVYSMYRASIALRGKKNMSMLPEIFCTCYLWPWLGPPVTTEQCYVSPVLWMTSCFHITGRAYVVHGEVYGRGMSVSSVSLCEKLLKIARAHYLCFFGSRPNDHYFRSVCLFVCLLCRVFLSRL